MHILLPPSEGKTAVADGPALDLAGLSFPELGPARRQVLDALIGLCDRPDDEAARTALGLSRHQGMDIARNAGLAREPSAPAERVYTGVLYEALGLAALDDAARARAHRVVLVFSGLWGVVRLNDLIPAYRCPIGAALPGLGALGGFWRGRLAAALEPATVAGLLLDLRSTAYVGPWRPVGELARRTAVVRVLQERIVDGTPRRRVVSHFNKATKGLLVRDLVSAGATPESPEELAATLRDLGHRVEGPEPVAGGSRRLDVVVSELTVPPPATATRTA